MEKSMAPYWNRPNRNSRMQRPVRAMPSLASEGQLLAKQFGAGMLAEFEKGKLAPRLVDLGALFLNTLGHYLSAYIFVCALVMNGRKY